MKVSFAIVANASSLAMTHLVQKHNAFRIYWTELSNASGCMKLWVFDSDWYFRLAALAAAPPVPRGWSRWWADFEQACFYSYLLIYSLTYLLTSHLLSYWLTDWVTYLPEIPRCRWPWDPRHALSGLLWNLRQSVWMPSVWPYKAKRLLDWGYVGMSKRTPHEVVQRVVACNLLADHACFPGQPWRRQQQYNNSINIIVFHYFWCPR